VGDLAGKTLIVGVTDGSGPFSSSLVHSLRMRLAPLDDIAKTPDLVLWGDAQHEGIDPVEIHLFVGEGAAIAIVTTKDDANRAIRIDPSGQFGPVHVAKN
jgi:hypothetical protein